MTIPFFASRIISWHFTASSVRWVSLLAHPLAEQLGGWRNTPRPSKEIKWWYGTEYQKQLYCKVIQIFTRSKNEWKLKSVQTFQTAVSTEHLFVQWMYLWQYSCFSTCWVTHQIYYWFMVCLSLSFTNLWLWDTYIQRNTDVHWPYWPGLQNASQRPREQVC